jgi:hypothetical protein
MISLPLSAAIASILLVPLLAVPTTTTGLRLPLGATRR